MQGQGREEQRECEGKNDKKGEMISRITLISQNLNLYPLLRVIDYQTVRKDMPETANRTYWTSPYSSPKYTQINLSERLSIWTEFCKGLSRSSSENYGFIGSRLMVTVAVKHQHPSYPSLLFHTNQEYFNHRIRTLPEADWMENNL